MKLVIDTNVVMDILLKREPFYTDAYETISSAIKSNTQIFISASAITDIFYILRKELQSYEEARKYLKSLAQLFTIADTTVNDINMALAHDMKDFEDAVVDAVASRLEADYIITRNKKDFEESNVPVLTPTEYVKIKNQ